MISIQEEWSYRVRRDLMSSGNRAMTIGHSRNIRLDVIEEYHERKLPIDQFELDWYCQETGYSLTRKKK